MKLSCIITTCCGDPAAWNQHTPSRRAPHKERARLLAEEILPTVVGFDEVIVAGRCDPAVLVAHPHVIYIHVPPEKRDRSEALRIRETATRYASGDIFVYLADDHCLAGNFAARIRQIAADEWDLITPQRIHDKTGKNLNNARPTKEGADWRLDWQEGYSPLHCQVMRRSLWAAVPWTRVDTEWCDVPLTGYWKQHGILAWRDDLACYDVEASEDEE